ncbi:Hypothetical protein, putative [Bodo saltans]|uniref:Uncharacterized protein n=1 Tax=Bodo saltans TaxID=75058 RepID=A0A0S4ITW5_BODSA|nr:Hypothetical protein, putative [Bodo saltans]|eukprot:CUF57198.1 Hypothetical protein, putative [Bodo saltans]
MPPLELNTRKHPPTNAPSKDVAKPRPPPQDRKGQPTKSKAELAIEEQYEQQQRLKMQQDAESSATGATGDLTTISMVTTSAISNNNNSTSQKSQHQPATSPQHARPVMQVPARNSDGGFNAVDSTFFYRAPLPTSPTSDEDEASASGSRVGSLTTSPRHRGAKNAASYFPDAKIRPLSPDFVSRRQTSPHNNSGNGGVTAAQIIEQARQQIKKNMQSEGPLSLGGSMITSSRTPAQQQQQHQHLGPKQRAGARTTTTQPAPPTTSSAQEPTSQQQQQPRQLDGALRVLSPPVTAPAQARRRPTLPGGSGTSREQALAALDHPPLAPHSGTDFSSTLPLMAVGGGGRLLKPLTTMGVPVGASPTPFWASATPDQHVHGDDTPQNATATTTAQQRWFPPYTSKDNEEDIEGVVGQSSAVQSPRTGGGVGVKSEHEGAGGKRSRSITDGSPDAMTLSDDNLNVNGFGRPTVNPKATVLAVGNPDTTDAKQRVHGFVPRRPNGADVMMDLIRKQRSESEVDVNNDSVLNLGVSGSGVHTNNNSSNSPTQQQRAQSPATSGSNGQTPRRGGAPPLGNVRRRESTGNTGGGGGSDSSAASPPPSRGGGVGR